MYKGVLILLTNLPTTIILMQQNFQVPKQVSLFTIYLYVGLEDIHVFYFPSIYSIVWVKTSQLFDLLHTFFFYHLASSIPNFYVFHLHTCVPRPLALKKGLSFYLFFHCLVTMVYEFIVKCVWKFFFYQYMLETAVICHRVQTVALTIVS